MCPGADGRIAVALLDELLFHVQLLLAQHPGISGLGAWPGQPGLVQPLAAQLHGLFQAPLQQAHAQGQLGVAGAARLPSGPDAQGHAAVAQPGAAQGVQLPGRVARGVQLVQHVGQQIEILHFFRCQAAQVVVEIQVGAARRGVVQQGSSGQLLFPARGALFPAAKIGHGQRVLQHQLAVHTGSLCLFLFLGQGRHLGHLHRLCRKQVFQQSIEPALGQLLPQGGKQAVGVQQHGRVAGVQPARGRVDGVQHAVRDTARPLQRSKLRRVQRGQQQVFRDALSQDVVHGFPHARGKPGRGLLGGTAQHQLQRGL